MEQDRSLDGGSKLEQRSLPEENRRGYDNSSQQTRKKDFRIRRNTGHQGVNNSSYLTPSKQNGSIVYDNSQGQGQ